MALHFNQTKSKSSQNLRLFSSVSFLDLLTSSSFLNLIIAVIHSCLLAVPETFQAQPALVSSYLLFPQNETLFIYYLLALFLHLFSTGPCSNFILSKRPTSIPLFHYTFNEILILKVATSLSSQHFQYSIPCSIFFHSTYHLCFLALP